MKPLKIILIVAALTFSAFAAKKSFQPNLVAANTLTNGLVACWRLDETNGTRFDASTNGFHLSEQAGLPVGSTNGILLRAADFRPITSGALIRSAESQLVFGNSDFTFSCWVNTAAGGCDLATSDGCDHVIAVFGGALVGYWSQLRVRIYDQTFLVDYRNGWPPSQTGLLETGNVNLTPSQWHLVEVWYELASKTIFFQLDNGAVSSAPILFDVVPTEGRVGIGGDGVTRFNGLLDQVCVWRRVLTATERGSLWNGGAALDPTK